MPVEKPISIQLREARQCLHEIFHEAQGWLADHEDGNWLLKKMENPLEMLDDSDWDEYPEWAAMERAIKELARLEREILADMRAGKCV